MRNKIQHRLAVSSIAWLGLFRQRLNDRNTSSRVDLFLKFKVSLPNACQLVSTR
jgi:hypothetical protein